MIIRENIALKVRMIQFYDVCPFYILRLFLRDKDFLQDGLTNIDISTWNPNHFMTSIVWAFFIDSVELL